MATVTGDQTGMVHRRRYHPVGKRCMASATGGAGRHRRHTVCLGSANRATSRRRSVVATGDRTISRSPKASVIHVSNWQPRGGRMTSRTLGGRRQMPDPSWCPVITRISMATGAGSQPGMIHWWCYRPAGEGRMAAAAGFAGRHWCNCVRFGTTDRAAGRDDTVMAGGSAVLGAGNARVTEGGRFPESGCVAA
jgi:hypothetical protein